MPKLDLKKIELTRKEKLLISSILLLAVLITMSVYIIAFLQEIIAPIFSGGTGGASDIHFNFEGYEALEL